MLKKSHGTICSLWFFSIDNVCRDIVRVLQLGMNFKTFLAGETSKI